ncbi:sialidase family protein [Lamprobacter modestohalophilus]|uniref:sialidase family protein n=1 Tax=Lamprobacter modestohalophilus TaxID=1064514 RepID=UPI002ADEDA2E|nr:sialidase family protein [Lamprobacter modestohalophilus]MEA1051513.1 sialidase family protein [Lamprobacter modestohalophilus]
MQFFLLMIVFLSTAAVGGTDPIQPLITDPLSPSASWDYLRDVQGRAWLAYYDQSRRLRLRKPDGSTVGVGGDDRNNAPSGLALTAVRDDDRVAVLWRDKLPSKGLFLWTSDSPTDVVENLDQGSAPLARILAASNADHIHALWYGEKPDPDTGVTYHLYYRNQALDSGELSAMEQVMPGIYPTWALDPDGTIMIASWTVGEDPSSIAVRFRDPETGDFGPRRIVAEDVQITPLIRAFRSGDRWFVLWHTQHKDDRAQPFSLHLAYTDDEGKTWEREDIAALRGYDVVSADIATDDDGRIFVAVDALDRAANSRGAKMGIWLIRSLDRGSTWSVENMRPGETMSVFHGRNPSVTLGPGKDQALVIWEDWQTIRPRLFGSLSDDNGKSWTVVNQLLPNQPDGNLSLRFSVGSLDLADGRYQVIAEQYSDTFGEKYLVQFDFSAADFIAAAKSEQPMASATSQQSESTVDTADDARLDALRERVAAFWKAMEEGDFSTAYQFYDPFFRALNSEQRFTALTGKITYADYETIDITLTGSLAQANGTVRSNVIPFRAPTTGELIEQEERWVPILDTWLWIDGQWYREFYSEGMDLKYTRY